MIARADNQEERTKKINNLILGIDESVHALEENNKILKHNHLLMKIHNHINDLSILIDQAL